MSFKNKDSFTLIELLVVIAILAILSVAVVLVINPADIIKQSRDTNRLTDLNNLNKALAVFDVTNPDDFVGTSSVIYVSIADNSSETCVNLGLPTLPAGYTYHCVTSSTLTKADGTGWIPVNFTNVSYGSPLNKLPIDPINTTTTGSYYTYVMGGSWSLSAKAEANRNRGGGNKADSDGGRSFSSFEIGSNLNLTPLVVLEGGGRDSDLVAYYPLDEGSGSSVYDLSGNGKDSSSVSGAWVSGRIGNALSFNGTTNQIVFSPSSKNDITTGSFSLGLWYKTSTSTMNGSRNHIITKTDAYEGGIGYALNIDANRLSADVEDASGNNPIVRYVNVAAVDQSWHHAFMVWDVGLKRLTVYFDGTSAGSATNSSVGSLTNPYVFRIGAAENGNFFYGTVDDVRVYNRVLSAAEVQAIYNSTR